MRIAIILSLGLLISVTYSAFTVDRSSLSAFNQFPTQCIFALVIMVVLPWFADSLRVQIWLRFLGKRERFVEVFRMMLASEMATAVTPAAIGGTAARLGWLISRGIAPGVASSIMLLNALEDTVFFLLALPLALLLSSSANSGGVTLDKLGSLLQQSPLTSPSGLSYILLGIIVALFAGWITWKLLPCSLKARVTGWREKVKHQTVLAKAAFQMMIARGRWRFIVTVALAGLHWACRFSMLTVLLLGLQQYVDPFNFFASQWLVFMLTKLAPSPGGTGGAELAFLFFYRSILPENLVGLLVGAWRVLTFTLPVGLATLLFLAFVKKGKFIDLKSFGLNKAVEAA